MKVLGIWKVYVFSSKEIGVIWESEAETWSTEVVKEAVLASFQSWKDPETEHVLSGRWGEKGKSHLCWWRYQCLCKCLGLGAILKLPFVIRFPSGERERTTVLFWSILCCVQVHLIPRMALCARCARLQTHLSQHPSAFVTYLACLLPHDFYLGNAFPTPLLPSAQGFVQITNIFLGNLHFLQMSGKMFSVFIFYYLSHVMIVLYNGLCVGISYSLGDRIITYLLAS